MSDLQNIIDEIYIKPIKSIFFVDDSFPTYARLISSNTNQHSPKDDPAVSETDSLESLLCDAINPEEETELSDIGDDDDFTDTQSQQLLAADPGQTPLTATTPVTLHVPDQSSRAEKLTSSCRRNGYIFDVESDPSVIIGDAGTLCFINKSDLIVLDYILDQHTLSSKESLQIIHLLNNTPRLNLVVIYTSKDPTDVGIEVAFSLRGKKDVTISDGCKRRTQAIDHLFETVDLLDFFNAPASEIRKILPNGQDLDKNLLNEYINRVEEYINDKDIGTELSTANLLACGHSINNTTWIHGENVFIVVVKKISDDQESIDTLIATLRDALCKHSPSPISMLTRHCANILKNECESILTNSFGDKSTRAALLYHVLTKDYPSPTTDDNNNKLMYLIQRSLETLPQGLQSHFTKIAQNFIKSISQDYPDNTIFTLSLARERVTDSISHKEINLLLNSFLCSQPVTSLFFTTGIVFRSKSKPTRVWICASPACDLVPDRVPGADKYRAELKKTNYFEAIRIIKLSPTKQDEAIKNATHGRHIFIKHKGKVDIYCTEADGSTPIPYIFYTTNNGFFSESKTAILMRVTSSAAEDNPSPIELVEEDIEIIGQLRYEYASRLLHKKGVHNSRIGVDFVNHKETT